MFLIQGSAAITVQIFTNSAVSNSRKKVLGNAQKKPALSIYLRDLIIQNYPKPKIHRGCEDYSGPSIC
jgi:hypothetical protein